MSALGALGERQGSALGALEALASPTAAWRDEQRDQFDRAVLKALLTDGATLRRAIARADAAIASAVRELEL